MIEHIKRKLALCVIVLSYLCAPIVMAAPISIEDLERFPAFEGASLSPDGKHVLARIAVEDQKWPVLSVWNAENLAESPNWIPTKEMMYVASGFFGNDSLIWVAQDKFVFGNRKDLQRKLYIADLDGKNYKEPFKRSSAGKSSARRDFGFGIFYDFGDGERYYINSGTTAGQAIYELNAKTGRKRNVALGGANFAFVSGGVNPVTGDLLVKEELDESSYVVKRYVRKDAKSPWVYHPELSFELANRSTLIVGGFDGSADRLIMFTNKGKEYVEARGYTVSTQTWDAEPLYAVPNYDVAGLQTQRSGPDSFPEVIGLTVSGPYYEQFFFDDYWAPLAASLKAQFPGEDVSIYDRRLPWQAGVHKALISIDSASRPTEYLLYDNGKFSKLGAQRPWLEEEQLPQQEWVTYSARDGLEVPGILSLPHGYDKARDGRIPVVIHPHGGPWARDAMGWDYSGWIPFLTSRGIGVLQPQYRGSDNLGMTLWKAGDGEWGQKMQDDKDDGAAWLVAQGIADPNKMAIFGYSYGGFAAIAASVRPNSPYQCAIAGAGVSNLDKLGNLWGGNRIQRAFQGHTVDGMDPIENVDKANIPILLYHGDHDRQADTYHSREFYRAMKAAKKDVVYHEIKYMWHQLPWWPEWQNETLTLIEDYLASDKCNLL